MCPLFNHETASHERGEGLIKLQKFHSNGASFAYSTTEQNGDDSLPVFIWAHGWGHSHKSFKYFVASLEQRGRHIALDFPGFGESPQPPEDWGTKEHATAIAAWMKETNMPPVIWIGHSYGCRIGTQLAAHYPECVRAMIYIGGAGLKRPRPLHNRIYLFLRVRLFKTLKRIVPEGTLKQKIMAFFGSADYNQTSGVMRKLFVRVVKENLIEEAKKITCPVSLIYGKDDSETPPSVGKKYTQLIENSELHLLDEQDHYSVLQNGRHQVIKIISDFLKKV